MAGVDLDVLFRSFVRDRTNWTAPRNTIRVHNCVNFIMWDVVTQEQVAVGSLDRTTH